LIREYKKILRSKSEKTSSDEHLLECCVYRDKQSEMFFAASSNIMQYYVVEQRLARSYDVFSSESNDKVGIIAMQCHNMD